MTAAAVEAPAPEQPSDGRDPRRAVPVGGARFAHASEAELARILDRHRFVGINAMMLRRVTIEEHRERAAAVVHQVLVSEPFDEVCKHQRDGNRDEVVGARCVKPRRSCEQRGETDADGCG